MFSLVIQTLEATEPGEGPSGTSKSALDTVTKVVGVAGGNAKTLGSGSDSVHAVSKLQTADTPDPHSGQTPSGHNSPAEKRASSSCRRCLLKVGAPPSSPSRSSRSRSIGSVNRGLQDKRAIRGKRHSRQTKKWLQSRVIVIADRKVHSRQAGICAEIQTCITTWENE